MMTPLFAALMIGVFLAIVLILAMPHLAARRNYTTIPTYWSQRWDPPWH